MNRTKSILVAGKLTGLVLFTILALGFSSLQAKSTQETVPAAETDADRQIAEESDMVIYPLH